MIGGVEETPASFEARSAPRSYPTDPHRPRVMRGCPRGPRRSVDRGAHRPAIEPRKFPILGADTVHMVEGNTLGRDSASARTSSSTASNRLSCASDLAGRGASLAPPEPVTSSKEERVKSASQIYSRD